MALLSIPPSSLGWGFLLPPADPSIFSTTRHSSRRHQWSRTERARSSIMAPTSLRTLIVGDPYARDLHHRMGTSGREQRHAEGLDCGCQHHVLESCRDL
jgi:hypothetical protein